MSTSAYAGLRTLDALDEIECRSLLRWEDVARIAFVDDHDAPAVRRREASSAGADERGHL
jgi:hypothetical protein